MTGLVGFYRARLSEDEAAATEAASRPLGAIWSAPDDGTRLTAIRRHIRRHDPARVLREVGAKRAIMAEHEPEPWGEPHPELLRCTQGHGDGYWTTWPCAEVRALAAVYSDHPDYQQGWKP